MNELELDLSELDREFQSYISYYSVSVSEGIFLNVIIIVSGKQFSNRSIIINIKWWLNW